MKILIADDEKDIVGLLKDRVVIKGHLADTAHDGKEALKLIKSGSYDLIFLDHKMPELTGLELLKYIRQNNLPLKVAMITGYEDVNEFFMKKMGADEYLSKPIKMKDIDDIIDKYTRLTKR